ncbi:DNA-binding transcriptional regulator, ArsR family [Catalinimonas alkaloidigena]|uniref:DNA-binding transcriptional regulator, ArsR family n=1 Tax=Catalinimonas alkaloidigena TaxID=1075417 RepID=A0A1G9EPZ7_9BACT|nr:metalloregulator ArsR/SmtB family transcription factor [Catalinimonas alkaloidigena]SDK78226.1 DNA-binding transcriptional regulator, ArsR family [Catalinimonas alkaloidigena]
MAYTKKDEFDYEEVTLAAYAKALGHPARIAILKLLAERGKCICGDIVNELPLSQSTVSQHLKELKAVGLIKGKIDGPRVSYYVDEETWNKARIFFDRMFRQRMQPVMV